MLVFLSSAILLLCQIVSYSYFLNSTNLSLGCYKIKTYLPLVFLFCFLLCQFIETLMFISSNKNLLLNTDKYKIFINQAHQFSVAFRSTSCVLVLFFSSLLPPRVKKYQDRWLANQRERRERW